MRHSPGSSTVHLLPARLVAWGLLLTGASALVAPLPARARDFDQAPALPAPSGTIVHVSTAAGLQSAVGSVGSNTTILLAAGTYNLTQSLFVRPSGSKLTNVAIRGATGNPADVVIRGRGMNDSSIPHGIHVGNVQGMLIANVTIRDVFYHPIQLAGDVGCQSPRVYNCRLIDAGEQFIKGSPVGPGDGVDNGIVEYTLMEYTTTCKSDYTNGVDIHGGANWIIRHNLFRRILAPAGGGLAGPAVLMWNRSSGTIVEGNRFIDCARDISLGLIDVSGANDHSGGVIRNNVSFRSAGLASSVDVPIFVADSPNTKVLHNTVFLNGSYPNAIETRFAGSTGIEIRHNLLNKSIQQRDGATGTVANNLTTASSSLFVNPTTGDLRLKSTASAAIDKAAVHADVTEDFDGEARPSGAGTPRDFGADEQGAGAPPANQAPVASATFSGTASVGFQITLDGRGSSDPDAGPSALTFSWARVSGPATTIQSASANLASFTPATAGTYGIRLTVSDGSATATANLSITIADLTVGLDAAPWPFSLSPLDPFRVQSRTLTNNGASMITVSATSDQAWVSAAFENAAGGSTLAPGASGTLRVTVQGGLSAGPHAATVTVTATDSAPHTVQIPVNASVGSITLAPSDSGSGGGGGCRAAPGSGSATAPAGLVMALAALCAVAGWRLRG